MAIGVLCAAGIAPAGLAQSPAAARDLAVNVDGIADWMTSAAYIDATAYFRRWGKADAGWADDSSLKLSADNLPLGDADAVSHLRGYPDGLYKLRWEGGADVSVAGFARVVPGTVKKTGAVTEADVEVRHAGPDDLVSLRVRNVDANRPLKRIELISPGYADASAVFRNEFVRRVRPFPTIRFMDWQQTNGNPLKEWQDRPRPTGFNRTGAKGVPVEDLVTLANVTRRDVWLNVPHGVSDDYVTEFAKYLRDNLHPEAIIHVEYSNEVWNFSFQQAKDNLVAARAQPSLTKTDDFGRGAQRAADRLGKIAVTFKGVFGATAYDKRVRPTVGGFVAVTYWGQAQLEFLQANYPGLVKQIAIAPYFGVENDMKPVDVAGATADQLFDFCDHWIDTKIADWVKAHAGLAKQFNVALVAYEGGVHFTALEGKNEDLKRKMQNDRRMARTLQKLFDMWRANGGGLFVQFGHIGPYSKFGYWALLERPDARGSVKWDYFMSKLLPPGDADLDGRVTAADMAIVQQNVGQAGKWWEDGDFNADGVVDETDVAVAKAGMK